MSSQITDGTTVMLQGRIVWVPDDLFKGKKKFDDVTKQPKMDRDGKQAIEFGIGLAVQKPNPQMFSPEQNVAIQKNLQTMLDAMQGEAYKVFPSRQLPPGFAWKMKDGDGVDHKGNSFTLRKGHAGHYVFALTTTLPMRFVKWDPTIPGYVQVAEGIKCGDYVQVQVQVKAHPAGNNNQKPGLYLNPSLVLFLCEGEEIVNAPSAEQVFGMQAPALPPGVTPFAGNAAPVAQASPFGGPQVGAPMMGSNVAPSAFPSSQPTQAPMPPAQPHYGVLPQSHQPAQFQQQAMPAAPMQAPQGFAPSQQFQPPAQAPMQQPMAQAPQGFAPPMPMAQQPQQFQQPVAPAQWPPQQR